MSQAEEYTSGWMLGTAGHRSRKVLVLSKNGRLLSSFNGIWESEPQPWFTCFYFCSSVNIGNFLLGFICAKPPFLALLVTLEGPEFYSTLKNTIVILPRENNFLRAHSSISGFFLNYKAIFKKIKEFNRELNVLKDPAIYL